jgi:hypothetical protein
LLPVGEERQKQSPAAAAAEQVRAIVEAAERETEAQLRRVQEAADGLAGRADEIERELERLAEGVREAVRGLREDLRQLRGGAAGPADPAPEPVARGATLAHAEPPEEIKPAAERSEAAELEAAAQAAAPEGVAAPASGGEGAAPQSASPAPGNEGAAPQSASPAPGNEGAAPQSASPAPGNEGARVIALNMALNGSPREETAAYLAENFELDDPDALLDDVYARAGG